MAFWEDLFSGGAAAAGAYDAYNRMGTLGTDVSTKMDTLGTDLNEQAQFQPYTVTSNMGGVETAADGSTAMSLNDPMKAYQDGMLGASSSAASTGQMMQDQIYGAMDPSRMDPGNYDEINNYASQAYQGGLGAMQNATGSVTGMQNDIYNQLRAAQQPGEQRAQLAMEERLLAQGRGGVQTDAYGGTPEQLAMQKAIGESKNAAFANAFGQAQQYQQNQLNTAMGLGNQGYAGNQLAGQLGSMANQDYSRLGALGSQMGSQAAQAAGQYGQTAMLPSAMLNDQMGLGQNNAQMSQAGQLAGVGMEGQLGYGGIQAQMNAEKIGNEMLAGMWGNLAGVAGGIGSTVDTEGWGGLWNSIWE